MKVIIEVLSFDDSKCTQHTMVMDDAVEADDGDINDYSKESEGDEGDLTKVKALVICCRKILRGILNYLRYIATMN